MTNEPWAEVPGADAETFVRRNLRRNYVAHAIDGGLYIGALAFVSATTVLPTMVQNLGGPAWLITLVPVLLSVGFLGMPIFTAHYIDRMSRYKRMLITTGVFQRTPYLVAGLVILGVAGTNATIALAALALAPLVSGAVCGLSQTGWQQLLARTIPENRRSSVFALRYAIACVIGIGAGAAVKAILNAYPGATGYGLLHLCTAAGLTISLGIFSTIREPVIPPPATHKPRTLSENLRAVPDLLRSEPGLARYLVAGAFMNGIFILIPFLAIRAQQSLGRNESYLGDLVMAQMAGAILGNLLAGFLGDRFGGKLVMILSQVVFAVMAAWSVLAASDAEFRAIFVLFGFSFFAFQVGASTLNIELCPLRHRSTYLAIISLLNMPTMVAATGVSALVWHDGARFAWIAGLAIACVLMSLVILAGVREPRTAAVRPTGEL